LWWVFAASVVMFLLTPIVVGWLVIRLPTDYFAVHRRCAPSRWQSHPALRPVFLLGKNLLGVATVLAGVVMLALPGQGLLTITVGLMLLDFPGKYRLERWLATRGPVWRLLNWCRRRAGREPLDRPKPQRRNS